MNPFRRESLHFRTAKALCVFLLGAVSHLSYADAVTMLQSLNDYPHAEQISYDKRPVIDHEIGLGAIQKVRGKWQFKKSERQSGTLLSYTWQIVDGFTSAEVMETLLQKVDELESARLLFSCRGRACGHGAQWANRVFGERVLYGRQEMQIYAVYAIEGEPGQRLVTYAGARSADRQYLRVDLLTISDE